MTDRIGQPRPMALPARSAPPSAPAGLAGEGNDFAAELRSHRLEMAKAECQVARQPGGKPEGSSETADFLGAGSKLDGDEAAKVFNADGFFGKLLAALSEPRDPHSPGRGDNAPGHGVPPGLDLVALPAFPGRPAPAPGGEGTGPRSSRLQGDRRGAGLGLQPGPKTARLSPPAALAAQSRETGTPAAQGHELEAQPAEALPSRARAQASREAFRLWLDGGSVHVAGPLETLSSEDEAELLDRVAELLSRHGLGLTGLSINGRAFALPLARK